LGVGGLKTALGLFEQFDFRVWPRDKDPWEKYSVVLCSPLAADFSPQILPGGPLLMRIDSGCETGQLFGDKTCDCREQLDRALERIAAHGSGLVINIPRQDGRGMGLPFKLSTLSLQLALGVDTVESGALLDPIAERDTRTYAGALAVLRFLGAETSTPIRLLTNNPKKREIFDENGFADVALLGIAVDATPDTEHHLLAKQERLGHIGLVPKTEGPSSE
jgi:GTP cyclohydrolase II